MPPPPLYSQIMPKISFPLSLVVGFERKSLTLVIGNVEWEKIFLMCKASNFKSKFDSFK